MTEVGSATAMCLQNDNKDAWPIAFIVLHEDTQDPDAVIEEIKTLCDKKIPPRDTAADFVITEELPHTEMGKIDFRVLEELAAKGE